MDRDRPMVVSKAGRAALRMVDGALKQREKQLAGFILDSDAPKKLMELRAIAQSVLDARAGVEREAALDALADAIGWTCGKSE